MKLRAKCLPEYFKLLDIKSVEFRQFESIEIENTETGEVREFLVKDVRKMYPGTERTIKNKYPHVPWEPDLPIFAIDLGDELDRNEMPVPVSVPLPAPAAALQEDRKYEIPESEKTWHGVGD